MRKLYRVNDVLERQKASWVGKGNDDTDGCGVCLKYEYEYVLEREREREKERRDCVCWLIGRVENGLEGDLP